MGSAHPLRGHGAWREGLEGGMGSAHPLRGAAGGLRGAAADTYGPGGLRVALMNQEVLRLTCVPSWSRVPFMAGCCMPHCLRWRVAKKSWC